MAPLNRRAPVRRSTTADKATATATAPARVRKPAGSTLDSEIADLVKAYSKSELATMELEAQAAQARAATNAIQAEIEEKFKTLANGRAKLAEYAGMDLVLKEKFTRASTDYPKEALMQVFREMTGSEEEAIAMAIRLATFSSKNLKSEIPDNRLKTIEKVEPGKSDGLVFSITRKKI